MQQNSSITPNYTSRGINGRRNDDNRRFPPLFIAITCHTKRNVSQSAITSRGVGYGATHHMCNDIKGIRNIQPMKREMTVSVGSWRNFQTTGIGNVTGTTHAGNRLQSIQIGNVLHLSTFTCNLLSVSGMHEAGLQVSFATVKQAGGTCLLYKSKELIMKA